MQQGGALTPAQREQVARLGIGDALLQPPKLDRATLAGLYRRAQAVLVPSEAEGFGLPVIEALACGAPVIASALPVLREVGDTACLYCPVGDVTGWAETLDALLSGRHLPPASRAAARACPALHLAGTRAHGARGLPAAAPALSLLRGW